MEADAIPEPLCTQLSNFIAEQIGLHFPPPRHADLQRGLAGAAQELGLGDAAACAEWLLFKSPSAAQLRTVAGHLTIGETYFFREPRTLEALAQTALPELIRARGKEERRLRLWSAACCTGEEPYSLSILLEQLLPDLAGWHLSILATDINERFLQKAAAGVYGEWSFRGCPPEFKQRYFERCADGRYAILPRIKNRVRFAQLNLAEDIYPSLTNDTNAMDVIFCRNVLMYFTPAKAQQAAGRLRRALRDDGWLAASPSEGSQTLFSQFAPVNLPGVILYRKNAAPTRTVELWTVPARAEPLEVSPPVFETAPPPETIQPSTTSPPQSFSVQARTLANEGRLTEALSCCEHWLAHDKLDACGHYVQALILQETGELQLARQSLQRAIYLQPDFVLAHFALAHLARDRSQAVEARRHLNLTLQLLHHFEPGDTLPESDGLTAGRLGEIVASILAMEIAA